MPNQKRQLAAIMFTDIVGYTALMGKDSSKALNLIQVSKEIQKPLVEKHNGKWLKEMGDGALAQFNTALDAVNCSIEIQKSAHAKLDAKLRIGIHLGDVTVEKDEVFGDGVNVAARIEAVTDPGGIYISDSVHNAVRGQSEVQSEYLGEMELKNVDYLVKIFALKGEGLPVPVKSSKKRIRELEKSIVVLPFSNLSPEPDDVYFSDGLTEELVTDLSRISELRVISSASTFRLKGTDKELHIIGQELQVRYAVRGRVRKAGQNVRITVQLIDLVDDSSVWADKYSGNLNKVFELQEQVSRAIADALHVHLRPPSRIPRPEAVESYLKGRHFFRQVTSNGFKNALDCFQNAIKIDPNYAPAYAGLAYTYTLQTAGFEGLPAHETMPKAKIAARHAFEIDPTLPEAQVALGLIATYHDWDLATADSAFREALRLNPNYADAHGWYTSPLIWLDTRFAEALDHARRAVKLNPVDPWAWVQLAWTHYFSRDFEGAIKQSQQLLNIEPNVGIGHYFLGHHLATYGKPADAEQCINRAIELDGRYVHYVAWLGLCKAISGKEKEARRCLAELESYEREGKIVWPWKLVVFAGLNNSEAVMQCLDAAFHERSTSLLYHLTHPLVDCVREHPRFIDLLKRMNVENLVNYRPDYPWEPTGT